MQLSQLHLHRRLDELAIAALIPPPPLPVTPASDSEVQIEVIWEADPDLDELAVTGRFVRFSAPYEKIEVEDVPSLAAIQRVRPTTFVRTVPNARPTTPMPAMAAPASATVPFDRVWFEAEADGEELVVQPPRWRRLMRSWAWLAVSLAVGGAAVAYMASL